MTFLFAIVVFVIALRLALPVLAAVIGILGVLLRGIVEDGDIPAAGEKKESIMLTREEDIRDAAVKRAAEEVMLAVRTSPKTRGIDNMSIFVVDGPEKEKLAAKMEEVDKLSGGKRPTFTRDAGGVRLASAVLLIGMKAPAYGLNCGFCGFPTCEGKNAQPKVPCAFGVIDLGIGSGVAAAILSDKHIDNRMMFSIGYAGLELGWFPEGVKAALGFPLSVSGKNPLFDRK